ncbi:MAG: L-threonylcarbamoyladenylate synthase [Quisquiliibacterium sp.]
MSIRPADERSVEQAAQRLIAGQAIAFPTETVYGLGADAASAEGIAAIYRIKGRPAEHPLIVHVLDAEQADWWGELGDDGKRLAQAFWPGPLTLILRRRDAAPAHACAGQDTVGLRSPSHPVARRLLEAFTRLGGHGLAAPSANRFGRVSPTSAQHVADDLGNEDSLIIDGGPCEVGVESTIVDISRGFAVLLRPGQIKADAIAQVLGAMPAAPDAQAPRASGTLAAHYAPRTPLELVAPAELGSRINALLAQGVRLAVWSREQPRRQDSRLHWEPAPLQASDYARALYGMLRRMDAIGLDRMLIEAVPAGEQWDAVRDRLTRAAATFSD